MARHNKHNQTVGSKIDRDDNRIKSTGEVFTPMDVVYQMIDEVPESLKRDPNSTFMDNSCGSGNFLYGLLTVLTEKYGHTKEHVVNNMIYGVDLMEDNIIEVCDRLGVPFGHPHFVVANGLKYHYRFDGSHPYDDESVATLDKFFSWTTYAHKLHYW